MNKTFFKSILLVGLATFMFSCKDDNSPLDGGNTPQGVNVEFDYSQAKLSRNQGASAMLNGSSDVDWTIEIEEEEGVEPFFSVEPMSGTAGEFTLTVTATKSNTSTDKQYSKFIFNASGRKYPITVIHLEDEIRLNVSGPADNVFTFATDGGISTFNVTANTEWIVKTGNAEDWIHFDETNVGQIGENMEVKVSVDPNPLAKPREGKFEVRVPESISHEYTVTQAPAALRYTIKDGDKVLDDNTGLTELDGAGTTRIIKLEANADWKIEAGAGSEWLTFEPSEGVASLEPVDVKVIVGQNDNSERERLGSFIVTFTEISSVNFSVQQKKGEIPADVIKLQDLESELEGGNSSALDWSNTANYENWDGVTFVGGKLIKLNLANKGLQGYVPAGIADFASLQELDLSNNELTANGNLPKIDVSKDIDGATAAKDQSYIPAIPVGIKDLVSLTTFKISGNKIEGIFPSDVVNNPNYLKWDAMRNIFPQNGVMYEDITYNPGLGERYTAATDANDPSKWKFKLNQIGILRVMYYAMGGENWKNNAPVKDDLLTKEFVITKAFGAFNGVNKTMYAVNSFTESNVGGFVPEECLMNASWMKMQIDATGDYKLQGSIHPLILQELTYLNFNNHDLDMSVNFIFANLNNGVVNLKFLNNEKIDGTITSDLFSGITDGKLAFTPFSFAGTGIVSGEVSVAAIKKKFKSNDQGKVTSSELKKKFPETVTVKD